MAKSHSERKSILFLHAHGLSRAELGLMRPGCPGEAHNGTSGKTRLARDRFAQLPGGQIG